MSRGIGLDYSKAYITKCAGMWNAFHVNQEASNHWFNTWQEAMNYLIDTWYDERDEEFYG